jgi:uncharacterized MAPEG superfamily protein
MSSELTILALYGLLVLVTILVQVLLAMLQLGLPYLASPRDANWQPEGIAARMSRTVDNSVVAMALFAPAVLILAAQQAFTPMTLLTAQIFLAARAGYAVLYPLGIAYLRTLVWLVGFAATAWLYVNAL